jgi:hypothetical protein
MLLMAMLVVCLLVHVIVKVQSEGESSSQGNE